MPLTRTATRRVQQSSDLKRTVERLIFFRESDLERGCVPSLSLTDPRPGLRRCLFWVPGLRLLCFAYADFVHNPQGTQSAARRRRAREIRCERTGCVRLRRHGVR